LWAKRERETVEERGRKGNKTRRTAHDIIKGRQVDRGSRSRLSSRKEGKKERGEKGQSKGEMSQSRKSVCEREERDGSQKASVNDSMTGAGGGKLERGASRKEGRKKESTKEIGFLKKKGNDQKTEGGKHQGRER